MEYPAIPEMAVSWQWVVLFKECGRQGMLTIQGQRVVHRPVLLNSSGLCTTLWPQSLSNGTITANSPTSKANLLNSFFSSCFCDPTTAATASYPPSTRQHWMHWGGSEQTALLLKKVKISTGPDGISSHMLWNTAYSISSSLCKLFNHSLSSVCFPTEWKASNVTPVLKSRNKSSCFQLSSYFAPFDPLQDLVVYHP